MMLRSMLSSNFYLYILPFEGLGTKVTVQYYFGQLYLLLTQFPQSFHYCGSFSLSSSTGGSALPETVFSLLIENEAPECHIVTSFPGPVIVENPFIEVVIHLFHFLCFFLLESLAGPIPRSGSSRMSSHLLHLMFIALVLSTVHFLSYM